MREEELEEIVLAVQEDAMKAHPAEAAAQAVGALTTEASFIPGYGGCIQVEGGLGIGVPKNEAKAAGVGGLNIVWNNYTKGAGPLQRVNTPLLYKHDVPGSSSVRHELNMKK